MKKLLAAIIISAVGVFSLAACTAGKTPCYSTKFVNVTFITKSGTTYTLPVPYCDTVKLYSDKLPQAAKMEVKE